MVEEPRRRMRPPAGDKLYGRLYVDVQQEMIAALAMEANQRGVSLSDLTRTIVLDWMRREMPIGHAPPEPPATRLGRVGATPNSTEK